MKTLKTMLPILFLFISSLGLAQIVNIPDANFKAKLLQADATNLIAKDLSGNYFKIDANGDGEIQESEALRISVLNVSDYSISTLTGIQNMTNIDSLRVNNNSLSNIDLSGNINLKLLDCSSTLLSTIDISNNLQLQYLNLNDNSLSALNLNANTDLLVLELRNNQFASIDTGSNLLLQTIDCLGNSLTSIDISNNADLKHLELDYNQLTVLDVSNNINLISLNFWVNQISTIDVSNNINLETFGFHGNLITSVDISNNINLNQFNCGANPITSLDVSNNPNLTYLRCMDTSLTELDISINGLIEYLDIRDNSLLTYVNLKNGNDISGDFTFLFENSFNLEYVCINENEFTELAELLSIDGYSASVSSYCSFTPGGDYNTIMGVSTFDWDNNGCDDNDMPFPYIKLNISDGTEAGSAYTGNTGNYTFYTQEGDFLITPDVENPTFFNVTPTQVAVNFLNADNAVFTQDFCITANGVHPDLEIILAPTSSARPGFDAKYVITYKNKGNQTLSGDVSLSYNDTVLDFISATEIPTNQSNGILTWDYSSLLPFESRSIYVTLNVNAPTDTPPVNIGDELNFTATINPTNGDEMPIDNQFIFVQTVVGSYDPNDITCLEGDFVPPSEIGNYLHYIINFENTGTAAAENIVVKTEIDPTMFDVNSLRLLSSSHNSEVRVKNNIVEIIFQTINLESGGHGNILLKLKSKPDLVANSTVSQDAEIFFDYNFPVETNNAETTFAVLSVSEFEPDTSIKIFPNPVKDVLNISASCVIKNYSLYDLQGRLIQSNATSGQQEVKLDMARQSRGVYFIKITSEKGVNVEKLIKN